MEKETLRILLKQSSQPEVMEWSLSYEEIHSVWGSGVVGSYLWKSAFSVLRTGVFFLVTASDRARCWDNQRGTSQKLSNLGYKKCAMNKIVDEKNRS